MDIAQIRFSPYGEEGPTLLPGTLMTPFNAGRKQSGFSLIELLLVLGISIAISALWLQGLRREAERGQGKAAGEQIAMVGQALNAYIALRHDVITAHTPGADDCTVNAPGTTDCWDDPADPGYRECVADSDVGGGVPGRRCIVTNETLRMNGLLPNSSSGRNSWGSTYTYQIVVTGSAPNWVVDGMVATADPYTTGGTVRYDLLGEAMLTAGADSGMTRNNPTLAEGYNGSWQESGDRFTNIDELGLLVYRVGYGSQAYNVYLRRDGSMPMAGDLNMDGYSILDALDIEASGSITGNYLQVTANAANAIRLADAGGTDRASIGTTGTGTTSRLHLRHDNAGRVSIETLGGAAGRLDTGTLRVSGTVDGPLAANSTITANGIIQGAAFRAPASSGYVEVGDAELRTNQLILNSGAGGPYGFQLNPGANTISLLNNSDLLTGGNIEANNIRLETLIDVGTNIRINGLSAVTPTVGSVCGGAQVGRTIIQRAASGELVQCQGGGVGDRWTPMGLMASNIRYYDGPTACTVPNSGTVQNSIASCGLPGEKLISGGYRQVSGPTRSGPVSSYRQNPTSWLISAGFSDPYGVGTITAATCWRAQAVCAQ